MKHESFPLHLVHSTTHPNTQWPDAIELHFRFRTSLWKLNEVKIVLVGAGGSFVAVYVATLSASVKLELAMLWPSCRTCICICACCIYSFLPFLRVSTFSENNKNKPSVQKSFHSRFHVGYSNVYNYLIVCIHAARQTKTATSRSRVSCVCVCSLLSISVRSIYFPMK